MGRYIVVFAKIGHHLIKFEDYLRREVGQDRSKQKPEMLILLVNSWNVSKLEEFLADISKNFPLDAYSIVQYRNKKSFMNIIHFYQSTRSLKRMIKHSKVYFKSVNWFWKNIKYIFDPSSKGNLLTDDFFGWFWLAWHQLK